jgi:hypothetical protein
MMSVLSWRSTNAPVTSGKVVGSSTAGTMVTDTDPQEINRRFKNRPAMKAAVTISMTVTPRMK